MKLVSLNSQKGFTLIELVAVLAIMGILAGVVAGAVTGFGASAQETRLVGDENTIGSSADRFFDDAFPQVYPVLDPDNNDSAGSGAPDGNLDEFDEPPLPAGDLGIRIIDFDSSLPQESTITFVPDFLKEVPDSAALGSWRVDTANGNVFLSENGAALVKPSLARLDVKADDHDALDEFDARVQSNHVFTLTMRKNEAPINSFEMVIPAGYVIGGQGLAVDTVVGTLAIVLDANNPWDTGLELTVTTVDVVVVSENQWKAVVAYDANTGGTSAGINVKNDAGIVGELADTRTQTISIVPPSGTDSQGKLTLVMDRITELGVNGTDDYKDPDFNEVTETWTLTLYGTDGPDGVDGSTNIITNPGTTGVFRWLAEENTAIDNANTFSGMIGNQAVVIR